MGARRTGRERALQALYQLDMTDGDARAALEAAWASAASPEAGADGAADGTESTDDPSARTFAEELVLGVREHLSDIDGLIQDHSHNWRLERMARIDRNILRLGIFELKYRADIPRKVTLNEAIELGKRFGTEESSAFINGLLDRVAVALEKP
jgi:N utilization substance protein B